MRLRVIAPVVLALVFALGACGGSSKPAASNTTTSSTLYKVAGTNPSVSSKMVCQSEASDEIASSLGMHQTRITTPTWNDHVYSCTYVYPNGSFTLSVKEMSSTAETTAYFDGYKKSLGVAQNLFGLGQGAFIAKNNDVIVRKDYKVLFVDVAKAPAGNGKFVPAMTRQDVATNIAAVIMGCWSDA
jgi:hypothetical protein